MRITFWQPNTAKLFAILLLSFGAASCGAKSSSKPQEDASAQVGNAGDTQVRVGTDQNTIAYGITPNFFWNNGKPDVPNCGTGPSTACAGFLRNTADVQRCAPEFAAIQAENLKRGFYMVKIPNHQFCERRCITKKPSCGDAWDCALQGLKFVGKSILEVTHICYEGCRSAIAEGVAQPLECRNIKDNPIRADLEQRVKAALERSKHDPEFIAKSAQISALNTETNMLNQKRAQLQQAETDLNNYVPQIYLTGFNSILSRLKAHNDAIKSALIRVVGEQQKIQEVVQSVFTSITKHEVSTADLTTAKNSLKNLEEIACKQFNFYSLTQAFDLEFRQLLNLDAELMRKVSKVENPKLTDSWRAKLEGLEKSINRPAIPIDFVNIINTNCRHFTKANLVLSLRSEMVRTGAAAAIALDLLKRIDAALAQSAIKQDAIKLKEALVQEALRLATGISQARHAQRFTETNNRSLAASKSLYFVMYPAVDLCQGLSIDEKQALKADLKTLIMKGIKNWDQVAETLGPKTLVLARVASTNRNLLALTSRIAQLGAAERTEWEDEWKQCSEDFAELLNSERNALVSPSGEFAIRDTFLLETRLSKLDLAIESFMGRVGGVH